jgi:hypothetical protein
MMLAVLTLLGVAILDLSLTGYQTIWSQRNTLQALYLAEVGVERTKLELNRLLAVTPGKQDFDTELTTNNGYLFGSSTGYADYAVGGTTIGTFRVQLANIITGPLNDGGTATDDTDQTLLATAEGVVTVGGHTNRKRVEVVLGPTGLSAFTMNCTTGSPTTLLVSGNPNVAGSMGSVHSNCNYSSSGNPNIAVNLTASGTITNTGSPTVGGQTTPGAPRQNLPAITPTNYKPSATATNAYIMKESPAPGIYLPNGTLVFDASGGGKWPSGSGGWEYSGTTPNGKWKYSGNAVGTDVQGKTFYFEKTSGAAAGQTGNVEISGNPGSSSDPWQVTIIAEGYIDVSGNPTVQPSNNLPQAGFPPNMQFIAGTDIRVAGNFEMAGPGIMAAHEQIAISGNPRITGFVYAENAPTTDALLGRNFISGNPTITYNGAPRPPADWMLGIRIIAWREL